MKTRKDCEELFSLLCNVVEENEKEANPNIPGIPPPPLWDALYEGLKSTGVTIVEMILMLDVFSMVAKSLRAKENAKKTPIPPAFLEAIQKAFGQDGT